MMCCLELKVYFSINQSLITLEYWVLFNVVNSKRSSTVGMYVLIFKTSSDAYKYAYMKIHICLHIRFSGIIKLHFLWKN